MQRQNRRLLKFAKIGAQKQALSILVRPFTARPLSFMPLRALTVSGLPSAKRDFMRHFSSTAELDEATYHELADSLLESLEPILENLQSYVDEDEGEFDVVCSQGVLTLKLGKHGTWVLNKQTPNRQIWWSSPISGPKRYYYDDEKKRWVNTKDGHDMLELLKNEVQQTLNATINIT